MGKNIIRARGNIYLEYSVRGDQMEWKQAYEVVEDQRWPQLSWPQTYNNATFERAQLKQDRAYGSKGQNRPYYGKEQNQGLMERKQVCRDVDDPRQRQLRTPQT